MPAHYEYTYTTGTLPATPRKSIEYHYNDSSWSDVLTGISEVTYTNSNTSTASAYSLNGVTNESSETDTIEFDALAQSLLGNNYRKVDLTDNAVVNVGNDALVVPSTNTSTYSTNSVTTNSTTLYTFQSDEIGNITNVSGVVDLEWNGRRLESISQGGTEILSYKYNIDGQRTKKIVTDPTTGTTTTTEFFYNGSILAGQKTGDNVLIFMYDNNGDVFGFTYNGTPYYYVKNAQNDVFLILDETGTAVVLYQYDAWGKIGCFDVTEENISSVNPITYRSYYVDLEMGFYMYYLNSRYYMADWGRFLSADGYYDTQTGVLSHNMFAYCNNNPVNYADPQGTSIVSVLLKIVKVVVVPVAYYVLKQFIKSSITGRDLELDATDAVESVITDNNEVLGAIGKVSDTGKNLNNGLDNRLQHCKNIVDAGYARANNQPFIVKNLDTAEFKSDIDYSNYCMSLVDSLYNKMSLYHSINLNGKSWDMLTSNEQQIIYGLLPDIDNRFVFSGYNDAFCGGVDFGG